ncbi:unnamed protein product [Thelazia callipaeda]|uniref:Transposase n=1 Tax=Thelazia callipaeda TaxID=103827 RepID=A0A0N5DBJ5_THECL|nr:unnamed protein product [Thelazia callipaeda]
MGAKKKKSTSETINEKNAKTDAVEKSYVKGVKEHAASVPKSGASRIITLEAIVCGIETSRSKWPEKVLKAVLGRFGTMQRGEWPLCRSLYSEKFWCVKN